MRRRFAAPVLFAAGVAFLALGAAGGQPPGPGFKFGDANKDGKLSREEFEALVTRGGKLKDNPQAAKRVFDRLDENKDGFLSPDEFRRLADRPKGKPGDPEKAPAAPATAAGGFNDNPTAEQLAFFEKKIRPALIDHCQKCHSADAEKVKGGLFLDTREGVRKGGDSGPAVVPGNPDRSAFIRAVRYTDESTRMPPKGKLPDQVIADFEQWVKMGAPDPRTGAKAAKTEIDVEKGREFWAFQKPKKPAAPAVKDAAWPRSDIDRFLLAALEARGLKPVADADPRTLIRRVTFDLTGLPPTPEDVDAFLRDSALRTPHSALESAVDRLLASPAFGERWGRHWLDVARYAESSGRTVNVNYPHAWRYRDYVIAAFNADKPFDRFVKEQLAGDLMPTTDPKLKAERVVATGFLAIGPKTLNERNGTQFELDIADEQIDVTTQAFLGITAACARCHDHKFDPIPTRDYYALAGIFRSTETCYGTIRAVQNARPASLIPLPPESGAAAGVAEKLTARERERIEGQIAELQKDESTELVRRIFVNDQMAQLRSRLDSFDADGNPKLQAMGVRDKSAGRQPLGFGGGPRPGGGLFGGRFGGSTTIADSPVYVRGEPEKPSADRVPRGTLRVMTAAPLKIGATSSGRLELAEWIASKDNPLTARVMANRVWLHLFGRGVVPTADNFGAAGQPPTNPGLLDHLAVTFTDDGWSVKKLIRRVVLSRAYQLGSAHDAKNFEADPENALVWRMAPRRLDAESLRDAMLAVSGQLDRTPPPSAVARAGEGPSQRRRPGGGGVADAVNDPRDVHRSVYLPIVRDNLPESLALFDAPDPNLVIAERSSTTVPAQSLFLLNNPFVLTASEVVAEKLLKETTADTERVRAAYLRFYGRPPSEKELASAERFLASYSAAAAQDRVPAYRRDRYVWAAFCQALFASAEFQFRN